MKMVLYVLFGLAVAGFAFWAVTTPGTPQNPLFVALLVIVFGGAPIGSFWMMYQVIRYEKNPWPLLLYAFFIPFSFLWYYFERVRPGRHLSR